MLKRITGLPLLFSAIIVGINIASLQPAKAQFNDSILYICIINKTNKRVYVSGEDNIEGSFFVEAEPNYQYWWWRRRKRSSNRKIKVFLNGKTHQAKYLWTKLSPKPKQLDLKQACFFNGWDIKEDQKGKLYLNRRAR